MTSTDGRTSRVAWVGASWHSEVVEQAERGFTEELARLAPGAVVDVHRVPGAFEIPLRAQRLARSGDYAAVVGGALVVDGGIYRHEFVAHTVVSALMQVQLATDVPVFSVVLTPHHFHHVPEHEAFFAEHFVVKGAEAARAVHAVALAGA